MSKCQPHFGPAKIGHNILWSDFPLGAQHEFDQEAPTLPNRHFSRCTTNVVSNKTSYFPCKSSKQMETEEIFDLEDMWTAVQDNTDNQQTHKIVIMNISNEPQSLTHEELQEIFGNPEKEVIQQNVFETNNQEEPEDFGQLWEQLDNSNAHQNEPKTNQIIPNLDFLPENQPSSVPEKEQQYFQIQEKDGDSKNRTCLVLGKNCQIYDIYSFIFSCFQPNVYSYFGFQQTKPNFYLFSDLNTNQPLMSCSVETYEQFGQKATGKKYYETDYCLKFRLKNGGQLMATMWQKIISTGVLYNLRQYNNYEHKYEDSLGLIEVTDGYIGNNCYCNTNVFLSQKYCSQPGPLKMKLSLKNGYLIAHMGVSGIKSAPYNCRLENINAGFAYLLGMVEKAGERFIIRVGEGMSPLISFAISIGRKRYIDSFKQ